MEEIGVRFSLLRVGFILGTLLMLSGAQAADELETVFGKIRARAAEKSYDIRIASEAADQASAQTYTAWTRWIPRIDLSSTQSRSKDYSILYSGSLGTLPSEFAIVPQAITLARWEFDMTFPIYRRTVHVGIQQASAQKRLAKEQLLLRRQELDWRLRSLLGQYVLQRYREAAVLTSIEIAKKNLREAELGFELGQKTKIDVLRSKSNLQTLQSRQLSYQQDETAALNAVVEYSGLSVKELQELGLQATVKSEEHIARTIDSFTRIDTVLPKISGFLDENAAPSLIDAQIARASTSYAVSLAEEDSAVTRAQGITADQFPYLDFRGMLNKQANRWEDALSPANVSYSAAIILTIPIFSGGSVFSSFSEKAHAEANARIKNEQDILKLRNGIENDRIQIRTLLTSVEAQRLTREQNEEVLRLSQKSYQLGKSTMVELLGAQNDLIDSKINLAKTKIDLAVLTRKLAWSLGVPLE